MNQTVASDVAVHTAGHPGSGDTPRDPETVLIVDDDDVVRSLTYRILTMQGYKVLRAASPAEAREICEAFEGAIHLLLSEVFMPRINGPELVAMLLNQQPEMRVLYTSGYPKQTLLARSILTPDVAFLPKPFTPSDLIKTVRKLLSEMPVLA